MDIETLPPSPHSNGTQKGFQAFVMTGDAMIQVTKSPEKEIPNLSVEPLRGEEIKHNAAETDTNSVLPPSGPHMQDDNLNNSAENSLTDHTNSHLNLGNGVDLHLTTETRLDSSDDGPTNKHNDSGGSLNSLGSIDDISLDMDNPRIAASHVDEPSAVRLAKRLFNLEGFKKSDVAYHLTRNNQFARKVTEEYLKYFDFTGLNLIQSMRKFFAQFSLRGETQERERVLHYFTIRYVECNPTVMHRDFISQDACHTLTCALMLLNTDLHGQTRQNKPQHKTELRNKYEWLSLEVLMEIRDKCLRSVCSTGPSNGKYEKMTERKFGSSDEFLMQNIGRKMTLHDFMENLSGLNGDSNYPKDLLKTYYSSVKQQPFVWASNDGDITKHLSDTAPRQVELSLNDDHTQGDKPINANKTQSTSFITVPTSENSTEYKRGILYKKNCKGPDGVPIGSGKRSWKKHFVIMRDMVLYILKSSETVPKGDNFKVILLHHSLAQVARLYKKKPFVFSLKTADWSEYLFGTTSADELEDWVNTINLVSASLSSEPLAAGVGSQKKFHRPLLPSAHTRLNVSDQVSGHEDRVQQLRQSIAEEENDVPNSKTSSKLVLSNYKEKLAYLNYELQRYVIYTELLKAKLLSYPDLESSMTNTAIGEVDDESDISVEVAVISVPTTQHTLTTTPLTNRSPANRYSYQQAVLNTTTS